MKKSAPQQPSQGVRRLRGIAHPVRHRILDELAAVGPMRAADVAARIDIPANQASFHLRQLAKYGLVEEASELARDGRDRVWRPVDNDVSLDLSALEEEPGASAAVGAFRRQMAERAKVLVDFAFRAGRAQPKRSMVTITSDAIALTKEEAQQYAAELEAVNEKWRGRGASKQRRTYSVLQILQPYPEESEPTSRGQ